MHDMFMLTVSVDGVTKCEIGPGLCLYVGFSHDDTSYEVQHLYASLKLFTGLPVLFVLNEM